VYARLRAQGIGVMRALVVGLDDTGRAVLRTMIARRELGYVPLGYLDDSTQGDLTDLGRVKALGGTGSLAAVLRDYPVDAVIITLPWSQHDDIMRLTEICQKAGVDVSVVPDLFQLNLRQVQFENMDGIPLLRVNGAAPFKAGNRLVKRVVDVVLVLLTAPVWLLVFALVALAIRLEGPGSIFYSATRVGENGRLFRMIKFRSMIENADAMRSQLVQTLELDPRHPKIKDDPRITRVGRFIRRTSIDELPNLINVLTGQMSLVGPRPPTPDEVALYAPWHRQRLQVKPGMTGLWQVNGRSEVPFDEMCLLDIYYIENWSMGLDAQILMMTIPRVLMRSGAY
jgi:exopolysaccharide biosynthesis polyprenyl glycosylphosphotransferase